MDKRRKQHKAQGKQGTTYHYTVTLQGAQAGHTVTTHRATVTPPHRHTATPLIARKRTAPNTATVHRLQ